MHVLCKAVVLLVLCSVGISALNNITITAESDFTIVSNQFASKSDANYLFFDYVIVESIAEDSFNEYTNLQLFYFDHNGITNIPENLFQFNTEIRFFTLSNNLFTNLHPNTFAAMKKVKVISLLGNKLNNIDEQLFSNNEELYALGLQDNDISTVHPRTFEKLVNLGILFLSGNRLSTLPDNVFATNSKLIALDMSRNIFNALSSAALFENNPELKDLNLDRNQLRSFDFGILATNNKFEHLAIRTNVLHELPNYEQSLQLLPQLNTIKLSLNIFNCSYYAKVYTHFVSNNITVLSVFDPATFESLDELQQSEICVSDNKYAEELARRLNIQHQKLPETKESIDASRQKLYELERPPFKPNVIAVRLNNILEDQKHCENGMEGYELRVFRSCENNLF